MRNDNALTKNDFEKAIRQLNIKSGSKVLLQADLSRFGIVAGSYQMLIEVLQEIVGPSGCICIPAFSYSCLDPACLDHIVYNYSQWKEIRKELPGFSLHSTFSDVYKECSNLFLQMQDVYRSNHPIYSFAYWGNFDDLILKIDVNEPLSFESSLYFLNEENAYNLMIGKASIEGYLLQALANELGLGRTIVQRAFLHDGRIKTKSFLITEASMELCQDLLEGCEVVSTNIGYESIYALSKRVINS